MDFQIGAAGIYILFVLLVVGIALLYHNFSSKESFTGYYTDLQKKESERYRIL